MKALLLTLLIGAANATGTPAPVPTPQPSANQTQSATATSTSKASVQTGARSESAAAGGSATGGSVSGDTALSVAGDSSDYKSLGLVLPAPASTPALPAMPTCDALTTQTAFAFGFGLFSTAEAKADPADCTLLKLRYIKELQCQYASAKQIEDLMLAKLLPGYQPTQNMGIDHTQAGCAALMNPPPVPTAKPVVEYQTRYIYLDPPKLEPAKVKKKKPCPTVQQVCKKE